jgi:hypothetical protein
MRARRTAVVGITTLVVGAAGVIAPTSVIVSASAAGVAPTAVAASTLAGAVTAAGTSAVVATTTTTPAPRTTTTASRSTTRATLAPHRLGTRAYNKWYARTLMAKRYGWKSQRQYRALVLLWRHESGWRHKAHNSRSGAHGIPQALPGSKMASAGPNWRSNPHTQIKWGLKYIKGRYGTPYGAWSFFKRRGWY